MSHLRCQRVIEAPASEVFNLATDPGALAGLLDGLIDVKLQNPGVPVEVGSEIFFLMGRYGVEQPIRYRIDRLTPGLQMTYSQTEGFLNEWRHTIKLEEVEKGMLLTDLVEYQVPFGLLGRLVDDFWWREELARILNQRLERIQEHFLNHSA